MNAERRSICTDCGRKFKSRTSLQQHKKMVHKNSQVASKPRRSPRRGGRNGGLGSDIAPSRIPPARGGVITVSGEDRLGAFDISASKAVFLSTNVEPVVSSRLSFLAKAYQRIKWNSVSCIVTPQASAITNGGYVAGFITDPSDRSITARDLTASQGSQTKKWYESAIVHMPPKRDLLYTSAGEDPRLSIPASFWIVSEGPPSTDLTVIVTILWNVTLSIPTVEDNVSSSFTLSGEIRGKPNNYNLSYFPPGATSGIDDFSSQIPPNIKEIPGYHYFRVPTFTIEYSEGSGDTGTIQAHFLAFNTVDKKVYYSSNGRTVATSMWQGNVEADQVCVPCATFCKYVGQGNLCSAVAAHPASPSKGFVSSREQYSLFSQRLHSMERLLLKLTLISETPSRRSSDPFLIVPQDLDL